MHSFQDTMFQFFALIYLADKDLNDSELKQANSFFINCLDFIDFEEVSLIVEDFDSHFDQVLNPIFRLVHSTLQGNIQD